MMVSPQHAPRSANDTTNDNIVHLDRHDKLNRLDRLDDDDIAAAIEYLLTWHLGTSVRIQERTDLSGGCIHRAERVQTNAGTFFVKSNTAEYLSALLAERRGLHILHQTGAVRVPELINIATTGEQALLLMEYIAQPSDDERDDDDNKDNEPTTASKQNNLPTNTISPTNSDERFWETFGTSLAALHSVSAQKFGLDHDNFIGSLPQSNTRHRKWIDFFVAERLEPMLHLASEQGTIGTQARKRFDKLLPLLENYFPDEPPALLHGDLWRGNFLRSNDHTPVLLDPAVYFGHREAELAFMQLFGGFSERLFDAYHEAFPLEDGWRSRVDTYNLYPLLVHLHLFGRSYWSGIETTLRQFGV